MSRPHSPCPLAPHNRPFQERDPGTKSLGTVLADCSNSGSNKRRREDRGHPQGHCAGMDDLSPELISHILLQGDLSPRQLCRLCELNRSWREAVSFQELWRTLQLEAADYNEALMQRISTYCGAMEELHIVRSPGKPRGLSLAYCSSWLYGLTHILQKASDAMRKLVISTGCNVYAKDYRSGPFYTQVMRRVTQHCPNLEECDIYYNAGRTGMRSDIPQWLGSFVESCPKMRSFRLWSPWGDCGGLVDAHLEEMVRGWKDLETLEVAGDGITLTGVLSLRRSDKLKELIVDHISLGPSKRVTTVKEPSDIDDLLPSDLMQHTSNLTHLELAHTGCDLLDVQIIRRLFPSLREVRIREYGDPLAYVDEVQEASGIHMDEADLLQHHLRQAELREGCLESPDLGFLVTFIDM